MRARYIKQIQIEAPSGLFVRRSPGVTDIKSYSRSMAQAFIRFYAELNYFLPQEQKQQPVVYPLKGPVAVKHVIEALGIPHTEVDLILADGRPVDFTYPVKPEDCLSVYPAFQTLEPGAAPELRPALPSPPGFVIDNHLGRLATNLRLLGFDALYRNDFDDDTLARLSSEEGRVLLTRDRRLLQRKGIIHGYCLRTLDPYEQLVAALRRYRLKGVIQPWQRCLVCNGRLRSAAKDTIIERLKPKTQKYYHEFKMCPDCRRIYWKGSHFEPLQQLIDSVLSEI